MLIFSQLIQAQTSNYEASMKKAISLNSSGKISESAKQFQLLSDVNPQTKWADYYTALSNLQLGFTAETEQQVLTHLKIADQHLHMCKSKMPQNDEVLVLEAMYYTILVILDPMVNGMKYSKTIGLLYDKALTLNPENPRAVLGRAEFAYGFAQFIGSDTNYACSELSRAEKMLENEVKLPKEDEFQPVWGKERVKAALKNCNN